MGAVMADNDLPEGFVIDAPEQSLSGLPEGFTIDQPTPSRSETDLGTRAAQRRYREAITEGPPELPAGWAYKGPSFAWGRVTPEQLAQEWSEVGKGAAKGIPATIAGGMAGDIEELGRTVLSPFGVKKETAIPTTLEGGYLGPRGLNIMNPAETKEEAAGMMISSMLTPTAAGKVPGLFAKGIKEFAPSSELLKSTAVAAYEAPEVAALKLHPDAMRDFGEIAAANLTREGFDPLLAPKTYGLLQQATVVPEGQSFVTANNFQVLRRKLGKAAGSADKTEREAAYIAQRNLDDFMPAIPENLVLEGDLGKASGLLESARGNYAAASRSERLQEALSQAEKQAARSGFGGNLENSTRQRITSILNSPAKRRGFSKEEISELEDYVKGNFTRNSVRVATKVLGGDNPLMAAVHAGLAFPSHGLSLAAPVTGYALKKLNDAMSSRQLARIDNIIRSRSPLAKQTQTAIQDWSQAGAELHLNNTAENAAKFVASAQALNDVLGQSNIKANLGILSTPFVAGSPLQVTVPVPVNQQEQRSSGGSVFAKMHAAKRRADGGGLEDGPFDEAVEAQAARESAARKIAGGIEGKPYEPTPPSTEGKTWIMEPGLEAVQSGYAEPFFHLPENTAVNDAGEIFNKETGKPLSIVRRPNVIPLVKTPDGIQWAMPKMLELAGNVMNNPLAVGVRGVGLAGKTLETADEIGAMKTAKAAREAKEAASVVSAAEKPVEAAAVASKEPPVGYFEIAPGEKWDPALKQSWEDLQPQAKAAVSNKMVGEFLSRWQRLSGIQGEIRPGLGGFEGYSNPNYIFQPYNPNDITRSLNELGELFHQDAMMGVHSEPFAGSMPAGVIRVNLPKNLSPDEIHSIYNTLYDKGLADGHSTNIGSGTMDILAGDGGDKTKEIANAIDKALENKYQVTSFPTNVAFPAKGESYGVSGTLSGGSSRSSAQEAFDNLQARSRDRLKELVEEAHRQGAGREGPISFGDTLSPGGPNPRTLSAAIPTTVKEYKGPPAPGEPRVDISPSLHSPENRENIALRMYEQHPAMWSPAAEGATPSAQEAERRLTDFHVKNLLALWDRTPVEQRQTSRFWYRAAHAMGNQYADEHGLLPQAAHGMMAVLSPQTPWDKNVTLVERVMDTLSNNLDTPWTKGMSDVAKTGGAKGNGLPEIKETANRSGVKWSDIEGKTLRQVLNEPDGEKKASMWVRVFDEAHNPREYQAVSPTGEFLGPMMSKSGVKTDTASWNSYVPIEKAISIYRDPSLGNINEQIGNNHKVREFYNVITNPNDPNGVVIDTHAVAAGQMLPHGSSAKAVHQNFGTTPTAEAKAKLEEKGDPWIQGYDPSKKTGSTGATGDYPIHAEAVRQAAMLRGVHPSEMQSVTWEAVRTLFRNKSLPMQKAAREVWRRYAAGELTHDQAIDEIVNINEGFKRPAWASQAGKGLGKPTVGSYQRAKDISAETPALPRRKPEPEEEEFARGGSIFDKMRMAARQ
jgi:hypothetical protein